MDPRAIPFQEKVASWVDAGRSLDEIETGVLSPSPLDEEERAALWLYAWSRRRRNEECRPGPALRRRRVPDSFDC